MATKINIAIDGPAGSGKTTIGKLLAGKLDYRFLDSGLLYRHFAFFCQQKDSFLESREYEKLLGEWKTELTNWGKGVVLALEKERKKLSSPIISDLASQLSPLPELRKITLEFQRQLTKEKGWVVVGRDITSEVLPYAEIKIFLTASLAERVKRRNEQLSLNSAEVKQELQVRDERDQNRSISPLIKTADSWELDTTNLSPSESVEKILTYIRQKSLN